MGYPQPSSEAAVVSGQAFFRLNTTLLSDGDMYESLVGCHAIAIGPESDISKVNIAYWDESQPGLMNQIIVDPTRPFVGQIDVHNEEAALYTVSNRPGRILIWPYELFNPLVPGIGVAARGDIVAPVLDIIQYFSPPGALPLARNDKTFQFQAFPWPAAGLDYTLIVPFYGRKYGQVEFLNHTGEIIDVTIIGLNYTYESGTAAIQTILQASTPVAVDGRLTKIILASAVGMFDAILFNLDPAATPSVGSQTPLKFTVSDAAL